MEKALHGGVKRQARVIGLKVLKVPNDADLPVGGVLPVGVMIGYKIDQFALVGQLFKLGLVFSQVTICMTKIVSFDLINTSRYTAQNLLSWLQATPYRNPDDWVFASNSSRAGEKRGKQPLWLQTIMRFHIQPVVRRLGITKRVSWHTFRRTFATLLKANGEDIKVVQELLRHGSTRVTLDIYAQAQMPAKRAAQHKVVEMVRAQPLPLAV